MAYLTNWRAQLSQNHSISRSLVALGCPWEHTAIPPHAASCPWVFHSVAEPLLYGLPKRFTEIEVVAQNNGGTAVLRPEQRCLHRHGEAAI